ncbi:PREDICTED: thioredoxin domain-containing protein 17 [Nanorana parkeri]|uniref:thioredoxin domain-containing protein 17 n=1 Tax=Nanorana parkeri TaxID=125878 RepID=UPI00085443BB|nr:PREDICTED: thioredoxin domain-containing protein 17 [Nanorana parkeri]
MADCTEVKVYGYEQYCKEVKKHHGKTVFALFCGDKNEDGVSWCPDCVKAEPVIRGEMKYLPESSVFIYCLVGERTYWKDPNNDFKKNLKLTGVPSLVKVGTAQKLTEEECFKPDLIQMLFSDD